MNVRHNERCRLLVIETREDNYQVKKQAEEAGAGVGDGRKYKPIYIYYIFIHGDEVLFHTLLTCTYIRCMIRFGACALTGVRIQSTTILTHLTTAVYNEI